MSKKEKLSVGRTKYRVPVYFWWSEASDRRIGGFFPSRMAATKWKNQAYWRYSKYPVMEHFLETVPKTMRSREVLWWKRHKDYYLDLTLEVGAVQYLGDKFDNGKRIKEDK